MEHKKRLDDKTKQLVVAVWKSASQTWPVSLKWMEEEALRQIDGSKPGGGPGMFLNEYLKKEGILE